MYLDQYKIKGTLNLDGHKCFHDINTYPAFQQDLEKFKDHLVSLVDNKESATFFKFGDGDYYFLTQQHVGSAAPGARALSKSFNDIDMSKFTSGANLCDYYTCEIYPENRSKFKQVIDRKIDYPAEYGYGLVGNKWFFETFKGRIGLIGASEKLYLTEELMKYDEYKEYLGLDSFVDYIHYPQKWAADDIDMVEEFVGEQLTKSSADIFLLGIGHSKCASLHTFKKYKNAIYMDVGGGMDMIAGCINTKRPYAGDWINFRIPDYDYSQIDYLKYNFANEKML